MKIGIFVKKELEDTDIPTSIISKINEYNLEFDQEEPDFVIFVGGDGTFLRAVHEYISRLDDICFIGINQGSLGFSSDFPIDDLDYLFSCLLEDDYIVRSCSLIEANFGGHILYAVNEVRIENPFHTLISEVYINDDFLENFRGNGLCVSSTFGSSAYNKSLGGSIIASDIEVLQLTEIAPINNRVYRSIDSPIVIGETSSITLKGNFDECVIGYDHLTTRMDASEINISLSEKKVNLVFRTEHSIVSKLREALIK